MSWNDDYSGQESDTVGLKKMTSKMQNLIWPIVRDFEKFVNVAWISFSVWLCKCCGVVLCQVSLDDPWGGFWNCPVSYFIVLYWGTYFGAFEIYNIIPMFHTLVLQIFQGHWNWIFWELVCPRFFKIVIGLCIKTLLKVEILSESKYSKVFHIWKLCMFLV